MITGIVGSFHNSQKHFASGQKEIQLQAKRKITADLHGSLTGHFKLSRSSGKGGNVYTAKEILTKLATVPQSVLLKHAVKLYPRRDFALTALVPVTEQQSAGASKGV